ncbi:MAG: hypothetical protein ACMVO5_03250 [Polymorphobacter sp.]|uniref:caspase family protein n=1 Tax=Polymorphobacter sp. TaxID=1909290 RepID=UPI003A86ED36
MITRAAPWFLTPALAALCLTAAASAAPGNDQTAPRIVVQVGHQAKVEAAVWANQGRNLVTLAQDGSLVVWDTASANILNTARLPVDWADLGLAACIKLRTMEIDARTGQLSIAYALDLEDQHVAARTSQDLGRPFSLSSMQTRGCEGIAKAASWYAYTYDLASLALISAGPTDIPPDIARRSFAVTARVDPNGRDISQSFTYAAPPETPLQKLPPAPQGTIRLEHNHDDGKRGDFNRRDDNLQFEGSTCTSLEKCRYGVNLIAGPGGGEVITALTGSPKSYFLDADLSPDGRQLVRVEGLRNDTEARVEVLELAAGRSWPSFSAFRAYHQVKWLGAARYALISEGYRATDDTDDAMQGFPPTLIIDRDCARAGTCPGISPYAGLTPTDEDGGFLGIFSLADCYRGSRMSLFRQPFCPGGSEIPLEMDSDVTLVLPQAFAARLSAVAAPTATAEARWQPLAQPAFPAGQEITAIRLSPDRTRLAVAVRDKPPSDIGLEEMLGTPAPTRTDAVWLYTLDSAGQPAQGRKLISFAETLDEGYPGIEGVTIADEAGATIVHLSGPGEAGGIFDLQFTPEGDRIIFTKSPYQAPQDGRLYTLPLTSQLTVQYTIEREFLAHHQSQIVKTGHSVSGGRLGPTPEFASRRLLALGQNRAFGLDTRELINTQTGEILARNMSALPIIRAGLVEQGQLLWGASEDGAVHVWDAETGERLLTLYTFPDNRFFAVTPDGRYDTNLGPDTNLIRWVVPDAPWQSLAAQTFMRDYYEPGLYRKLLECRAAQSCANAFAPLGPIASLNRVLPEVEITSITPGRDAGEALVSVRVTEGVDLKAANGKTRSGIRSPRLFLNNKLVAAAPEQSQRLVASAQEFAFRVPLPTGQGTERLTFSAYAFNEDRIKSETASLTYARPPATPRNRRAFVINIGIDHYTSPQFSPLSFAGNDATLLASRLGEIAGHDTHQITIGARAPDGRPPAITRQLILDTLALLVTEKGRTKTLRQLQRLGIDAAALNVATPDDIVIISYAGHGWAEPRGAFFLIPSDARWEPARAAPEPDSVISTQDLTALLERVQAGEISLIIDACHSAASVDSGDFKPGPMGDSSLGQLAFDKGIRILAAAQADDVALEDSRLRQGLLTYALAAEGLTDEGGASDQNRDGEIRLDEWLSYAVDRLPELSEDVRRGTFRGVTFLSAAQPSRPVRIQRPSLFDFNTAPSQIILRSDLAPAN